MIFSYSLTEKLNFLIDEDSLGVERYIATMNVNIKKVGSVDELPYGVADEIVAQYAKEYNCVVITQDENLVKQCNVHEIKTVSVGIEDLAKKILQYIEDSKVA